MVIKILQKGGREPLVIDDATLVVVEDNNGNPVSVACAAGLPGRLGTFEVAHLKDPNFNDTLRRLGIHKVVIGHDISKDMRDPAKLPSI